MARIGKSLKEKIYGTSKAIDADAGMANAASTPFGAEKYESKRFRAAGDKLLRANLRYVLIQGIPSPFIEMVFTQFS